MVFDAAAQGLRQKATGQRGKMCCAFASIAGKSRRVTSGAMAACLPRSRVTGANGGRKQVVADCQFVAFAQDAAQKRARLICIIPSELKDQWRKGCAKRRFRAGCAVSCWKARGYEVPEKFYFRRYRTILRLIRPPMVRREKREL